MIIGCSGVEWTGGRWRSGGDAHFTVVTHSVKWECHMLTYVITSVEMFVQLLVRLTQYLLQMEAGVTVSRDYSRAELRYNWVVIRNEYISSLMMMKFMKIWFEGMESRIEIMKSNKNFKKMPWHQKIRFYASMCIANLVPSSLLPYDIHLLQSLTKYSRSMYVGLYLKF